jgi:hypothetical protein
MTVKTKFLIALSLFVSIILIANFALAEDDNESETERVYEPVINQVVPVSPVSNITTVVPITPRTEIVQPVSTVTTETSANILIDSDSDGIINLIDKYPGKDDFSFNVLDVNKNGIIDELEYLLNL